MHERLIEAIFNMDSPNGRVETVTCLKGMTACQLRLSIVPVPHHSPCPFLPQESPCPLCALRIPCLSNDPVKGINLDGDHR